MTPTRVKPPAGPPWSVADPDRRQTPASKTILANIDGPVIIIIIVIIDAFLCGCEVVTN